MLKTKRIIFLVILGFGILFLILGTDGNRSSEMKRVANQFVEALRQNDFDRAYAVCCTGFQASFPKDQMRQHCADYALHDTRKVSWREPTVIQGYDAMVGYLIDRKGNVAPVIVGFIENEGSFEVYSFSLVKEKVRQP